jgi:hypothetical protein
VRRPTADEVFRMMVDELVLFGREGPAECDRAAAELFRREEARLVKKGRVPALEDEALSVFDPERDVDWR